MMKPGNGKRGTAPCGCPGEYLTANYVACLGGCTLEASDFPSSEFCPKCMSNSVDEDYELDPLYAAWNLTATKFDRRCWDCGALWVH